MAIIKTIKANPIATVGLFLTLAGVAFGIVNYIILSNISPIEIRVQALDKDMVKKEDFAVVQEKVLHIEKTVDKVADRLGVID